jgi:ubiquinone/menaquinone biosynthesis C-methylase UbiE
MKENGSILFEIIITEFVLRVAGKSVYKKFADSLELQGSEQVLDFGCGLGTVARYVAPLISDGKLVCADISPKRLNQCQQTLRRHKHVECIDLLSNSDPFEDETYDVIYCHFVLHEIDDSQLRRTLQRMFRWLKSQGKLVFKESANDSTRLRDIDNTLQEIGFVRDSTKITDIPLMGNAIEGRYTKEWNSDGAFRKG